MTGKPLTDAEVICSWMEPKRPRVDTRWWRRTIGDVEGIPVWENHPQRLTLDMLHEVETRLTDEQWRAYVEWFQLPPSMWQAKRLLHADAPTKIAALAAVLRPLVEGAEESA